MTEDTGKSGPKKAGGSASAAPAKAREQRLKAALKANMGRRKAQVRARAGDVSDDEAKPDDASGPDKE